MRMTLFILFFSVAISMNSQSDTFLHWSFENELDFSRVLSHKDTLVQSTGIIGKGVKVQGGAIDLSKEANFFRPFSILFWFKADGTASKQTLFYQFKKIPGDYYIRNFVKLELEKESLILKDELNQHRLESKEIKEKQWYQVAYVFDGRSVKVYLQGQILFSASLGASLYQKEPFETEKFFLVGKGHSSQSCLTGIVDEISLYERVLSDREIQIIYERELRGIPNNGKMMNSTLPVVNEYKVLDPLVVRSVGISLELEGKGQVLLGHNDKVLESRISLDGRVYFKKLSLNLGQENSVTIEGVELNSTSPMDVVLRIKEHDKLLASYNFNLSEANIVLPIAYLRAKDQEPKNFKQIRVNSEKITLQIKDNSKVDGDVITIKQGNKIILENYTLTADFKTIEVIINKDQPNDLTFIPVNMGKAAGENTALVLVFVDNELIYDFSLKSSNINEPALLRIVHESF